MDADVKQTITAGYGSSSYFAVATTAEETLEEADVRRIHAFGLFSYYFFVPATAVLFSRDATSFLSERESF